jgi:ubiquinone/menaquinone biosynthesis C-methylase UbiE
MLKFDEAYFSAYKTDPKRENMYAMEAQRIFRLVSSGRVLDIGCGIGAFLERFDSRRWEKYGVDVSDFAIQQARSKGIRVNEPSQAYDFPDAHFDLIVLRGSIQHMTDPDGNIKECRRLLKPSGFLVYLSTPNINSPYYRRYHTLPVFAEGHKYFFPSDTILTEKLAKGGFKVLKIRYPYPGTPYASIVKDHWHYLMSFFGRKTKFPFWRSMMEIYAQKAAA